MRVSEPVTETDDLDVQRLIAHQAAVGDILQTLGRAPFDLDALLDTILTRAAELCHAEHGFIYLRRDDGLYSHVAAIGAGDEIVAYNLAHPISPGRNTMVGRTAIEERTVHIPDRLLDAEYDYPEAARLGGFRAMLGVPMLREGEVVGVVALWRDEPVPFTEDEIEVTQQFADEAVIALTTTQLAGTIERQRGELARFLSPQVAALVSSPEGEQLLAGHRREITVVFCDLRGFTAFSESTEPEDVMHVLREYHAALGRRITEAGGTLERFTGDGVMVFFNDPVRAARPRRARRSHGPRPPDRCLRAGRWVATARPSAGVRGGDRDGVRDHGTHRLRGPRRLRGHRQRRQPQCAALRTGGGCADPARARGHRRDSRARSMSGMAARSP